MEDLEKTLLKLMKTLAEINEALDEINEKLDEQNQMHEPDPFDEWHDRQMEQE